MGLENASLIKDLNVANPAPGDSKSEGDDHLRMVKKVLKTQFPNLEDVVRASAAKLNADNRVKGSSYESIIGATNPMLEIHRPGQVSYAWVVGTDNRLYCYTTGGGGNLVSPMFSTAPEGGVFFNNAISVQNSVACAYSIITAAGSVSQTMRIPGLADRTLHRNGDAMGFLGLDGNWNAYSHNNGDLWVRGNISGFSDERYKRDWRAITDDQLLRFSRIKYCGIYTTSDTDEDRMGVSAQKLKRIFPEAVTKAEGKYGVAYGQAALALVHKLAQKVLELERRLAEYEK